MVELVLGGEGLIGAELVSALRAKGNRVISLDLKSGCDLRFVDIEPFAKCDRVWFLAWDTGGAKYIEACDTQHQMYKHNCELSVRVFDFLAESKRPFLFVTSQLAGQPTAYGITKLMGERWAMQLGGKIARLWNVYGWEEPDVRSHVITDLVLAGLSEGRVKCLTNGEEHRRFLYKQDCVHALTELFDSSLEAADIASDEWVSIKQVAWEVARQLNVEAEFGPAQGSEVMVSPQKLLPLWRPSVSLSEGISCVVRDARAYLLPQQK